ncbi:hypothetical protein PsYK624_105730 [Phanerochaete sordida]|uniref:C2H2-type domain-containing protein n=1 Tax=Phanerochaete sordida TaxID=48140 RepID=A0A9P3LH80_9APHY|nr:hypothetical protein PsYK624_105730 [Phanerochaete sordida]
MEAYNASLTWHHQLEKEDEEGSLPSKVTCPCGAQSCSAASARMKHVKTHLPLTKRDYVCEYCGLMFAQKIHLQCHHRGFGCTKWPKDKPRIPWECGVVLLDADGQLFACGYAHAHARNLSHHRQDAHGQPTRAERRAGTHAYRRVLTREQRTHRDTHFVPMPYDCAAYDLARVPARFRDAVAAAAQREVDAAPRWLARAAEKHQARLAEERRKRDAEKRAAGVSAAPKSAAKGRKGKGKANGKPTAKAANAKRKARSAAASSRSSSPSYSPSTPALSDLTSLPPASSGASSPTLSSPTSAPFAPSTSSRGRQTASTAGTSPCAPPLELAARPESPRPYADAPYADAPYDTAPYDSTPYAPAPHTTAYAYAPRPDAPYPDPSYRSSPYAPSPRTPPALPRFHDAFGSVPPLRTVWSHVPPSPPAYTHISAHDDTPGTVIPGEYAYRGDRSPPAHHAPRYDPYAPPRPRACRRAVHDEFVRGASRDVRAPPLEQGAYRYPPIEPPVRYGAARDSDDERGGPADAGDDNARAGFRLRPVQW